MIFIDLETTSLDAHSGILVAMGILFPNEKSKVIFIESPDEEKRKIEEFFEILRKSKDRALIIWYSPFDIPFLITRAIKHGIDASFIYEFDIIDLCKLVRENLKLKSNKLDEVSKFFGIKKDLEITGRDVQILYIKAISGDKRAKEKIIEHCIDDLRALEEIYKRLEAYVKVWRETQFKK